MHHKEIILFAIALLFAIITVPGALANNSCINCHENLSAFNETEQQFNDLRIKHLAQGVSCSLDCHATVLNKFAINNYEQWTKSKHAMFNVTCDNCHGGDPAAETKEKAHTGVGRSTDPNSTIYYRNVPETCGRCHTGELTQFRDSMHYQRLKALKQAPTCDTCHQPHEFKVLNVSGLHDLCSNCHNPDMKIAPDVPDKATAALQNAEKLKNEIQTADNAVKQAKQDGKDVSTAQKNLDTALSIQTQLPVLWHSFNLEKFESVIESGIKAAEQATIDTGVPVATPTTVPGFGIVLPLAGIIIIYLWHRK